MIFKNKKTPKKKLPQKPDVFKGVVVLVFFAIVTAFVFNNISPYGISFFGQWDPQKGVVSAASKNSKAAHFIEILSSKQVVDIIQAKQRLIIDVRPKDMYERGHIPTAVSFPLNEFDKDVPAMTARINRQTPVLVYCSSVYCTDSHTFASYLEGMGYTDIQIFSGGFAQWQEEGNKIETNEK